MQPKTKEALHALRPLTAKADLADVTDYDAELPIGLWRPSPDWLRAVSDRFAPARALMIPGVAHRIAATIESELLRD